MNHFDEARQETFNKKGHPMGRPRKTNVKRNASGRSYGEQGIHPETLAIRERHLREAGVPLTFMKREMTQHGWREVEKRTAEDRMAGYTLGLLRLRDKSDPASISQAQFEAGVPLTFMKREMTQHGWREVEKRTAEDLSLIHISEPTRPY